MLCNRISRITKATDCGTGSPPPAAAGGILATMHGGRPGWRTGCTVERDLLCGGSLLAQSSRGSLSGAVSDPSGATVPGAAVELRSQETGIPRSTLSNDAGLYRFDAVDPALMNLT